MKNLLLTITIAFCSLLIVKSQEINVTEVFSADHDWERLFNGQNLDGWQVKCQEKDKGNTFWSVDEEKGAIFSNSIGSKDHGYVWLMHEKEFSDFE